MRARVGRGCRWMRMVGGRFSSLVGAISGCAPICNFHSPETPSTGRYSCTTTCDNSFETCQSLYLSRKSLLRHVVGVSAVWRGSRRETRYVFIHPVCSYCHRLAQCFVNGHPFSYSPLSTACASHSCHEFPLSSVIISTRFYQVLMTSIVT